MTSMYNLMDYVSIYAEIQTGIWLILHHIHIGLVLTKNFNPRFRLVGIDDTTVPFFLLKTKKMCHPLLLWI